MTEEKNALIIGNVTFLKKSTSHWDILDSEADLIVIPVNCVGVMGAGLAKQCAERNPRVEESYKDICETHLLVMGKVAILKNINGQRFGMLPTKHHWSDKSRYNEIREGLLALRWVVEKIPDVKFIAIPKVGCGLGGLGWPKMSNVILNVFHGSPVHYIVYGEFHQLS